MGTYPGQKFTRSMVTPDHDVVVLRAYAELEIPMVYAGKPCLTLCCVYWVVQERKDMELSRTVPYPS